MVEALSQLAHTLFNISSGNPGGTSYTGPDGAVVVAFKWLTSADVLPFFAIGIGCSLALFGIKVIRSVVWGS